MFSTNVLLNIVTLNNIYYCYISYNLFFFQIYRYTNLKNFTTTTFITFLSLQMDNSIYINH